MRKLFRAFTLGKSGEKNGFCRLKILPKRIQDLGESLLSQTGFSLPGVVKGPANLTDKFDRLRKIWKEALCE